MLMRICNLFLEVYNSCKIIIMMDMAVKPSCLTSKPYKLYIFKLQAWREVTEISKETTVLLLLYNRE